MTHSVVIALLLYAGGPAWGVPRADVRDEGVCDVLVDAGGNRSIAWVLRAFAIQVIGRTDRSTRALSRVLWVSAYTGDLVTLSHPHGLGTDLVDTVTYDAVSSEVDYLVSEHKEWWKEPAEGTLDRALGRRAKRQRGQSTIIGKEGLVDKPLILGGDAFRMASIRDSECEHTYLRRRDLSFPSPLAPVFDAAAEAAIVACQQGHLGECVFQGLAQVRRAQSSPPGDVLRTGVDAYCATRSPARICAVDPSASSRREPSALPGGAPMNTIVAPLFAAAVRQWLYDEGDDAALEVMTPR